MGVLTAQALTRGMIEKQLVDAELTKARTDLAKARHHREAIAIAQARGELIEKSLVERQAAFILFRCGRRSLPSRRNTPGAS